MTKGWSLLRKTAEESTSQEDSTEFPHQYNISLLYQEFEEVCLNLPVRKLLQIWKRLFVPKSNLQHTAQIHWWMSFYFLHCLVLCSLQEGLLPDFDKLDSFYSKVHYLFFLQLLLGSVIGEPQIAPELFLNRLNISYCINYKYDGQLNHNIDRVWVVTKIKIPKYEEIKFPNISFDPECKFLDSLKNGNTYRHIESIKQLSRDSAPLVNLFRYKENYKQRLIQQLLNEDLTLALKGIWLRNRRSTLCTRVPKSNESFVHNSSDLFGKKTDSIDQLLKFLSTSPPSYSFQTKRGFTAFIPALSSLATIAVESIGSFLQKKHNAALSKGLNVIKSDQSLAWNSIKQLEDDFLLYGKYNLDSLEKIIHTVNHLGERVH